MVKRVTITDIAKAAKISPTTVSLILNGKGERFSQETCERVFYLRDRLGYRVEKQVSSPKHKQLKRIGVVIPNFNQSFYNQVITGIQKSAGPNVLITIYEGANFSEEMQSGLRWIFEESLDGLILCGPFIDVETLYGWAETEGFPIVIVNSQSSVDDSDVWIDLHRAGQLAAEYLLDNGHRDIAVVVPENYTVTNEVLLSGFKEGMQEYHEELAEADIYPIVPTLQAGYELAKKVVLNKYTAVFAGGDEMAIGIMRGLVANGRHLPADQSVLGFGNSELGDYTTPQLSSIDIPSSDIGRAAFDKLEELSKNNSASRENLLLPIGINKRFSVKHI
ncbi:LacI family transcriptional regulator [Levilactobacillus brevis]|uniref:LacI family DNA-binding transcriptional regulator n=1 Tax=Levilactobacillus brevis TaxID=1580 RepID=UPI000FF5BD27|nr:LacI family DNA-binding transcriptional regulator [Levilactobacillus brevis]RWZ42376.1 LacI family transcriptional regulator [Levilactobacillus brevis]